MVADLSTGYIWFVDYRIYSIYIDVNEENTYEHYYLVVPLHIRWIHSGVYTLNTVYLLS